MLAVASCQYKDKWPREERAQRARPADTRSEHRRRYAESVIPNHVRHCYSSGARDWWIYTWNPQNPALITRVPYKCNSWRCPSCRRHEGAVTFARVKEAFSEIQDFDPERVAFCVLTLDRDGYYSGEPWKDEREAYRALSTMARKLLKRVNRHCEREGWEPVQSRWVATVEAHKSGWPHYQLMLYVPKEWAEEIKNDEGRKLLQGWFGVASRAVGWGARGTLEMARSLDAVNGYLIKTCGAHEKSVGEVSKLTQLPLNAPTRFRRLRSGKGFLPPRRKGKATGTLIRRGFDVVDGTPMATPLHEIKDPVVRDVAAECCYQEERFWRQEQEAERLAKQWPEQWRAELRRSLAPDVLESWRLPEKPPPLEVRDTTQVIDLRCEAVQCVLDFGVAGLRPEKGIYDVKRVRDPNLQ